VIAARQSAVTSVPVSVSAHLTPVAYLYRSSDVCGPDAVLRKFCVQSFAKVISTVFAVILFDVQRVII